jgi:hypothetical protein
MAKPTFLEALARPYALSQRHLLSESDFISAVESRGLAVSTEQLERLAKDHLLEPTVKISKPVRGLRSLARKATDWQRRQLLTDIPPTTAPGLLDIEPGYALEIASASPHRPWKQRERSEGSIRFHAVDFLYSPYRLLLLPGVQRATNDLANLRGTRKSNAVRDWVVSRAVEEARNSDEESALLTVLEPIYYPSIVGKVSMPSDYGDFDRYQAWQSTLDPAELYRRLDWPHEGLRKLAERYINRANDIDPIRRWIDLVRLMDADHWEKLEGPARLAIDLRMAAELILRFLEDLADREAVPPLPDIPRRASHPLRDRLRPDRSELDETLLDYGLSPHPSLVLVLEGSCEELIVPRVLRHYDIPVRDDYIKILPLGGLTKNPELVARYLTPSLRRLDDRHAVFLRPPSHVLVVADAEVPYETARDREARRADWIRPAFDSLDDSLKTPAAQADLGLLVVVTTWSESPGRTNFEYSHFSAGQLARAILATGRAPHRADVQRVRTQIEALRARGKGFDHVWRSWPDPQPDKLAIWDEHLWPRLEHSRPSGSQRDPGMWYCG